MIGLQDFVEFTLTSEEIRNVGICFAAILTSVCVVARVTFAKDPKRMAWIVSIFNSFVTMIVGFVYLIVKVPMFKDFFMYGDNGRLVYHSMDNVSVLTCLWFAMACVFDLGFGLLCYRKYLDPLTAYVHHTVFIWIMITATTGNGGFITAEKFAPSFLYMLVEELPTFLLGLGMVVPALRTDIGFGVTFFLLRIVYHAYFFTYSIVCGADTVIPVLYSLTMCLHLFWFYSWVTKYGSKLLKKEKKNKD